MKKQFLIALLAFAALCPAFGQETEKIPSWARETKEQKAERMAWWTHDRFGLFIHWGVYSLPARGEGVKRSEWMSDERYQRYFENFNPDFVRSGRMGGNSQGCRNEISCHHDQAP